ncbi:hypothetical protein MY10362_004992 [Beauveria mimosiformis]
MLMPVSPARPPFGLTLSPSGVRVVAALGARSRSSAVLTLVLPVLKSDPIADRWQVLPAVSAAATAAQRWLLDNAELKPAEARVNAEFKALIKAAVQARAKAGGLVAEEAADRLRSSGGATAYPTFTITTAPAAAAAPAASGAPAAADTAPGRPLALVDRDLLSEMLSEMRKTNNLLKELVQSAGSMVPDREQFVALVQGEVSLRFSQA